MVYKYLMVSLMAFATTVRAQERVKSFEPLAADTMLHLPTLNSLGQVPHIGMWPMSYTFMGYHDWQLHSGLNMSFGASVFAGFGKYTPSGAGFAQNIGGMYAVPLTPKLSMAAGAYLLNADWDGLHMRDAGVSGVLGYQFNERWEGYLYGQKSLMQNRTAWPFYDMQDVGDRIGAAIKYNIAPGFHIKLSYEERKNAAPYAPPRTSPVPHGK